MNQHITDRFWEDRFWDDRLWTDRLWQYWASKMNSSYRVATKLHKLTKGTPGYTQVLRRENISVTLNFMSDLPCKSGGRQDWRPQTADPYLTSVRRWLKCVDGVQNSKHHELTINIVVYDLKGYGSGIVDLDFRTLRDVNGLLLPTSGCLAIHSDFYTRTPSDWEYEARQAFNDEFLATITHEIGHILGIGTLWNLDCNKRGDYMNSWSDEGNYRKWVVNSPADDGLIYAKPASAAVKAFNQIFERDYDFLPVQEGHLYNLGDQQDLTDGNGLRMLRDGSVIPDLSEELMGHGDKLSAITLGLLEDIGWRVNYDFADQMKTSCLANG